MKQLQSTLSSPKFIMTVEAVHNDGTMVVVNGAGKKASVVGDAAVGQAVYVQSGRDVGVAPNLPV